MSQLMDAFRIGQMLGNAYGNLWVANANKRDDKKIENITKRLNGAGEETAPQNPLIPTTEDYEQAMAANAETPSAANLQKVDLGNPLQQKAYDAIMGNKNLQPISTMAKNLGVRQNPLMDDVRKAIGVSTTISPEYEKERADVANAIAQGYTGNIDLSNRPRVRNEDGSVSTVKSMSFNEDGKEVLIPQVSPDGKIMNEQEAIDRYRKTGENLGKFNTVAAANEMARRIHDSEEQKLNKVENTGLNWKPNFSALDLDKAMKAEGIGKSSRDRAIEQYKKETAERAQQEMLPAVIDRLAGENPHAALRDILRYSKYDPSMANVLMKDLDRAIDFENKQKLRAQDMADRMALAQVRTAGRGSGGGRGGSGGGGGRGGSSWGNIKAPTEKQALELVKEYQAMFEGASDADRPGVARMLASARAELEALRRGGPNAWYALKYGDQGEGGSDGERVVGIEKAGSDRGPDVDIDNYDEVKNAIMSFPANKRREAVQNYGKAIAKEYGEDYLNNDMYRSMWYEFINDGNEPWLTKAEKNKRVMEKANGDWDRINEENAKKGQSPLGRIFSNEFWENLNKENSRK